MRATPRIRVPKALRGLESTAGRQGRRPRALRARYVRFATSSFVARLNQARIPQPARAFTFADRQRS